MARNQYYIFINSLFFVLGFSVVFSFVGILLQTILSNSSFLVLRWLGRIGGIIIMLFGLYLLNLLKISFLEKEHKFQVKRKFKSSYIASFLFGSAFAVGWTPCIGAVLGAILTLAITQPTMAFFLLFSYSIGLGIPFLLVGLFTNQANKIIQKILPYLRYLNYFFGVMLIILGILVFTSNLAKIANLSFVAELLLKTNLSYIDFGSSVNLGIAFLAGLISFLSPCVLPLIPAFLLYLASITIKNGNQD
ncbi:sulfite exporter TauE/SafE family protein [Candidatus Woesearchaeota archaeon]|nr:sulfite exporter TauE/SafE family protein [Candidatus Woesearchaeota archaeon]